MDSDDEFLLGIAVQYPASKTPSHYPIFFFGSLSPEPTGSKPYVNNL